ncbi:MAG: MFS transporter [Burkholderiales bacterium]
MIATLTRAQVYGSVAMSTAVQTLTAFALAVPSVIATVAAPDVGMPAARVGVLVSVFFCAAIVSGLLSGALSRRFGPIATLRYCVLLIASALAIVGGAHISLVIVYALLAGVAHGVVNPVCSLVLAQAVPTRQRSMMFSIKQTGVPLGSAVAGVLLPPLLLFMIWGQALFCLALGSVFLLLALRPFYVLFDTERDPLASIQFFGVRESFEEIMANPRVLQLVFAATTFSLVQLAVTTFLVIYLHVELGYSLLAAGAVFSALSIASVFGRVFWGWIADRTGKPRRVLAVIGMIMGVCCLASGLFSSQWPTWAVVLVALLLGASAVSWNGVFLAEIARLAPEGRVAGMTSCAQAVFFAGSLIGTPLFGAIADKIGSFAPCYLALACLPIACGAALLRSSRLTERQTNEAA